MARALDLSGARGVIVYEGPSLLDGAPIVAVATLQTSNRKTGPMAQLWILRADVHPRDAVHSGGDASVCGACPHHGTLEPAGDGTTRNRARSCYVDGRAMHAVYDAWRRGRYLAAVPSQLPGVFSGRGVRLGAYGDPAAVPPEILRAVVSRATYWTGYTHQWRDGFALADLVMASCETDADIRDATAIGYRCFRVTAADAPRVAPAPDGGRFMTCPAETRAGLTCAACRACDGRGGRRSAHVQIEIHGQPAASAARAGRLPVLQ